MGGGNEEKEGHIFFLAFILVLQKLLGNVTVLITNSICYEKYLYVQFRAIPTDCLSCANPLISY